MSNAKQNAVREYTEKVLGFAPKGNMKNTNGMDEIDMAAAAWGQAERELKILRPRNRQCRKRPAPCKVRG